MREACRLRARVPVVVYGGISHKGIANACAEQQVRRVGAALQVEWYRVDMADIEALREMAQAAFAMKHAARERALPKSRTTIRFCANAVRSIHRGDFATAATLLADAQGLLREMHDDLRDHLDIYYAGFVADAQKEFAEASVTAAIVQGQPLPTPATLGVELAPYLNGLGEAVGELRRHTLDELRHGNLAACEPLLGAMDDFFALIVSLDYPDAITNNLRRTADVTRGILEKTRGDLTAAVVQAEVSAQQAHLSEQIARLSTQLAQLAPQADAESTSA